MMAWQNVAALWALPLVAVPIIIHLLRMHRAERVPFPSLRFVQASQTAAVRFRLPSDWLLLAVRMAVVALAVIAIAGPVVLTASRLSGWNARTARAVVVDVSDSMRTNGDDGVAPSTLSAPMADSELKNAAFARRFDVADLRAGLQRAAAWLADAPPARREMVVISDFQHGALDRDDLDRVPTGIGVRTIAVGRAPAQRTFPGVNLIGRSGTDVARQTVSITAAATSVTIEHQETSGVPGVRFIGTSPDAILRVLATVGTPAGDAKEPIAFRFAGEDNASAAIQAAPVGKGWMLRTVVRLRNDPSLTSASTAVRASEFRATGPWLTIAADAEGSAVVRAASAANELVLDVASPTDSLYAATVVRAALRARAASVSYSEQEIARVDDSVRSTWNRSPGAVSLEDWKSIESTDARWCWVAVLGLLGVEQWLRSPRQRNRANEVTRAAA